VHDDAVRTHLTEASGRVSAIGRAYERLSYDADVEDIDLGPYLQDVCADAISVASHCKLDFDAVQGIQLDADRAISLALIINELVTNSAKYAFSDRSDGHILGTPGPTGRKHCSHICARRRRRVARWL
jgi:two-component sensor histidine kinase